MTTNQSAMLVKNPHTKKAMAVLAKFAQLDTQYKALEKEAKEATELIKNAMIEQNINKLEVDLPNLTGYITLAEHTSYKAEEGYDIDEKYLKQVLDGDKVKAERTLTGILPHGVIETTTQYITKKFKEKK